MELTNMATILILATLVEGLVEHLVKPLFFAPSTKDDEPKDDRELIRLQPAARDVLLRYVAAVAGILLCLAYRADLLALANYLHDLVTGWALNQD
jgi:hypothetical protein